MFSILSHLECERSYVHKQDEEKQVRPTSRLATVDAWYNRPFVLLNEYYVKSRHLDFGKIHHYQNYVH